MKDKLSRYSIRKFLTEGFFDEEPQSTSDIMMTLSTFLYTLRQVPGVDQQELEQIIELLNSHRQTLRRGHVYPHISDNK